MNNPSKGAVPSCHVIGVSDVSCAHHSNIGLARWFWRRQSLYWLYSKEDIVATNEQDRADLALRPFMQYNIDTSLDIDPVNICGEMSVKDKIRSMASAAATGTRLGPDSSFPFPLRIQVAFLELCERICWIGQIIFPLYGQFFIPTPIAFYHFTGYRITEVLCYRQPMWLSGAAASQRDVDVITDAGSS